MDREDVRPGRGADAVGGWLQRCLLVLVAFLPMAGHAADYTTGPLPGWVVPVAPGKADGAKLGQGSDGVAFLLTDTQILADRHDRERYHRVVSEALDAHGVEAIANIQIPFDPSYQKLVLHSLDVIRHGRVISQLHTAKMRVIQREAGLEERIYDGTRTLAIFLDDVRPGDVVDYSYVMSGRNPVFGGRDFGTYELQFGLPVARVHARLLVPVGASLKLASRHTAMKPRVTVHDGLRDYTWDVVDPPVLTVEAGAPAWYSPFAQVSWSQFDDWGQVVDWALPLYRTPDTLDAALQAQVDRIARTESTPAGRMLAALRLVQGEVRYLGVEIGPNSHAPNPPTQVYARRFGDCKDKTLLTVTLLRHLGIDAWPALVNTDLQRGVAEQLPSPGVFDHVLVLARVDGKDWWIDPTRNTQMADLAHLSQDHFDLALVVAPGGRALTAMKRAAPDASRRELHATYDASHGFDTPVRFTMKTVASGDVGEALRNAFASNSLAELQKNFLNFYAGYYPHIGEAGALAMRDDPTANRVTVDENYMIHAMSAPADDGRGRVALLHFPELARAMNAPDTPIRTAPLQVSYPLDLSQQTEVLLPNAWPVKTMTTRVDDPAFRFERSIRRDGLRLLITDHFQSLTDEVPAAQMPRYLDDLARARKVLAFRFWWNPALQPGAARGSWIDHMNWLMALLAVGMAAGWAWLAARVYRYDPEPAPAGDRRLAGFAGWLVVLGLVLGFRLVMATAALWHMGGALAIERWTALTTFGAPTYNALWAPLLLFELAGNLGGWVFTLLVLALFLKRRSSFPRVAMLVLVSGVLLQCVDLALSAQMPTLKATEKDIATIVRAVIGVSLWSAYLIRSQRVKATFVVRHRTVEPPELPDMADPAVAG